MCTSRPSCTAVISMPGTKLIPQSRVSAAISATAATVSWSVTLIVVMPARHAMSTSSEGVQTPSDAVVWRWRSMTPDTSGLPRGAALPRDQALVFANEQIEVGALLFGKLHEDLLPFGVLEPLAVFLEELVRASLAADADHQRLLIVHSPAQAFGTFRKKAVRGAFEEEERRARLQRGIRGQQLRVAGFGG